MLSEPEAIRQEMDQTRSSLTDKIGLLEEKVVETVHEASANVRETVTAVKEAVGETVDTVKETFSLSHQVRERPWVVMMGGAGLGFLAGCWVNSSSQPAPKAAPFVAAPPPPRRSGNGSRHESFGETYAAPASRPQPQPVSNVAKAFEDELLQLRGLAIGALGGIIRDFVSNMAPEMVRSPLRDAVNDFTTKLGGHPFPEPVLQTEVLPNDADYRGEFPNDTRVHQRSRGMDFDE